MLSFKKFGIFNEGVMFSLFSSQGFKDLRGEYVAKALLATADAVRPGRVGNCAEQIQKKDKTFLWESAPAEMIIDRVYGLYYIIEVAPTNERIGFDFATDPESLAEKVSKAKEFAPLWKTLGVTKVVVLLSVYPDGDDQGLVFYDEDEAKEDIFSIILDVIEGEQEVSSKVVQIKRK